MGGNSNMKSIFTASFIHPVLPNRLPVWGVLLFVPPCLQTAEFSSQVRHSVCRYIESMAACPKIQLRSEKLWETGELWALHFRTANLPPFCALGTWDVQTQVTVLALARLASRHVATKKETLDLSRDTRCFWCGIHLWFRLMGGLQAKSMTSQRNRAVTRWRICYYGNVMTTTRWRICYYGNVMTTTRWRICYYGNVMTTRWRICYYGNVMTTTRWRKQVQSMTVYDSLWLYCWRCRIHL